MRKVVKYLIETTRTEQKLVHEPGKSDGCFLIFHSFPRPLDPDESVKINSDDESIPYKKDTTDDTPEPTESVKVMDSAAPFTYSQPYDPARQARPYGEETEIN